MFWETSTNLLVRYPDSAVFNDLSDWVLREPWVDKKNSAIDIPSLNDDVIGISTNLPLGLLVIPLIPAICLKLSSDPLALENIIMKIGLSGLAFAIWLSSFWTSSFILNQTSTTLLYLSSSVISPRLYCFSIFWTSFSPFSIISDLLLHSKISASEIVIPDLVDSLNPKSFILSSIIEVSVVWYLLNTSAIICSSVPFLNGSTSGILAIFSLMFWPLSTKYLLGVIPWIFSSVGSLI